MYKQGSEKIMKILLTNDDGIHAPGMDSLCGALHGMGDIWVVAPSEERSACGHGITLNNPLRVEEFKKNDFVTCYAVNGTPADCVKMAVQELLPSRPDLLISGINLGSNLGINVIYSGTVAGAVEGSIQGLPAVAISLISSQNPDFQVPCEVAQKVCEIVKRGRIDVSNMLLNINCPKVSSRDLSGIFGTTQGVSRFIEDFYKRSDTYDRPYYWMGGSKESCVGPDHSDENCVKGNGISVMPLQYDLTDYHSLLQDHPPKEAFALEDFLDELRG